MLRTKTKLTKSLLNQIEYDILPVDDEVYQLSDKYISDGVFKEKSLDDSQHVAVATVNNCDLILPWNFKHIVKHTTFLGVNGINRSFSYKEILLYSPYEFDIEGMKMEDNNLKWIRDIRDNNYEATKNMAEEEKRA